MDGQSYIRKPEAVAQMCSVKKVLVEISKKTPVSKSLFQ